MAVVSLRVDDGASRNSTATFADWEQHTQGFASKMLSRMGFVKVRAHGVFVCQVGLLGATDLDAA